MRAFSARRRRLLGLAAGACLLQAGGCAAPGPLLSAAVGLSSIMVQDGLLPRDDDMRDLLSADWLPKETA